MGDEKKRGKDPRKFTWQEILTFVAGAGYVASPIDLLSEGVLGPLGLGDDAVAIIIAGVTLFKAVQRFRQHRTVQGTAGDTTSGTTGSGPATPGGPTSGATEDASQDRKPRR